MIAPFGVYVHIPFCAHRCDYCDFATWTDRDHLVDDYVAACIDDLRGRATPPATSVFFGGGTPSLLAADRLVAILDAIERAPGCEVTVECNPDSVDAAKFARYAAAGVDRVSLGAQSFVPHVLRSLNRTHDPGNVAAAIGWAREAGIERINVDVIYGTVGESLDDWRRSVDAVLELGVTHVSAYALTVEPATPLGRAVAEGGAGAPDDDDQADKYVIVDDLLAAAGLENYEVSNWAVPGAECRHNVLYWTMGEYVAIGCAGHGHTAGARWWNVRTPERYIARIGAGRAPESGREELDAGGRAEEAFTLALRTRWGAPIGPLAAPAATALADLTEARLVEATGGRVRLTRAGRLLASDVTARLLLSGIAVAPGPAPRDPGTPAPGVGAGTRYH